MTSFDPQPIAMRFWKRVGTVEPFPRRLQQSISVALDVGVVFLPKLTIAAMTTWFARSGIECLQGAADRRLRGCLLAQRGHAFIFVDGSLPDDEQRFTLAHETSHFLHHYESPRLSALALLGHSIEPVLNGDRSATSAEQLRGALRNVPLGIYEHMLDRSDNGAPDDVTERLESEADLIAFELLAPSAIVRSNTRAGDERRLCLAERFGLPAWAAERWGSWLDARDTGDSFIARLERAREKSTAMTSNLELAAGSTTQLPTRGRRT